MCVKYKLGVAALLLIVSQLSYSQESEPSVQCLSMKSKLQRYGAKVTVADPAEDSYDMKYLKFNLQANNLSTTLHGDVTTVAQVVASSLPAYVFELKAPLVID